MVPRPCILGFASSPWSVETGGAWYDTHIGGHPIWPENPPPEVSTCPRCNAHRYLVLQAYAPHSVHKNRSIIVFGCNNIRCAQHSETWLAWRVCQIETCPGNSPGQQNALEPNSDFKSSEESSSSVKETVASVIDWDNDTDSSDTQSDDILEDLERLTIQTELAKAKKQPSVPFLGTKNHMTGCKQTDNSDSSPVETKNQRQSHSVSHAKKIPAFQAFHVDVEEEEVSKRESSDNESVNRLLQKYLDEERNQNVSGGAEHWAPESDDEETPDRLAFQNFQDVIARAPTQILRYAFASQPLWPTASPPTSKGLSMCSCGAAFVFELQLLGTCLHYLRPDKHIRDGQEEAGMSFKTIALFTCSADCTTETENLVHQTSSFSVIKMVVVLVPDEW